MGAKLPWEGVHLCWDVKAEDKCPFGSNHLFVEHGAGEVRLL